MENRNDLRVIKTKENIKSAFWDLIKEKPVEKITVTELAKNAKINKGTFYLHYADIYELYEDTIMEHLESVIRSIQFFPLFFLMTLSSFPSY